LSSDPALVLVYPFANVYAELAKIEKVDGHSGGLSPITFRWLTDKNRYVNIGLEESLPKLGAEESCFIEANNNSFAVTPDELVEIFTALKDHMDKLPKPLAVLTHKEQKTTSIKQSEAKRLAEAAAPAALGA